MLLLQRPPPTSSQINAIANGPQNSTNLSSRLSSNFEWQEIIAKNASGEEKPDGGGASGSFLKRVILKYKDGQKQPNDPDSFVVKFMDTTKPPDIGFGVRVLFVLLGGAKAIFDLYARNEKYYFDDFVSLKNTVPLTLNTSCY